MTLKNFNDHWQSGVFFTTEIICIFEKYCIFDNSRFPETKVTPLIYNILVIILNFCLFLTVHKLLTHI